MNLISKIVLKELYVSLSEPNKKNIKNNLQKVLLAYLIKLQTHWVLYHLSLEQISSIVRKSLSQQKKILAHSTSSSRYEELADYIKHNWKSNQTASRVKQKKTNGLVLTWFGIGKKTQLYLGWFGFN